MFWWNADQVSHWLTRHNVYQYPDGLWSTGAGMGLSANHLIHEIIDEALGDPELSVTERMNLGFGMLDFLDDYAVAMYLRFEFVGVRPQFGQYISRVWEFFRELLERPAEVESVTYWLWVDWFEDAATSDEAFREVTQGFELVGPEATESDRLHRRLARVIRASGPVSWDTKFPVYQVAIRVPTLTSAVRDAIDASRRDVYGQIDEHAAERLLLRLR